MNLPGTGGRKSGANGACLGRRWHWVSAFPTGSDKEIKTAQNKAEQHRTAQIVVGSPTRFFERLQLPAFVSTSLHTLPGGV